MKIVHFSIQVVSTSVIHNIIILYKPDFRKQTTESLIIKMTKSYVPKSLIKNRWSRTFIKGLMRQEKLNTTITLVLVENFLGVQGLDWKDIFIKIAPAVIVMT